MQRLASLLLALVALLALVNVVVSAPVLADSAAAVVSTEAVSTDSSSALSDHELAARDESHTLGSRCVATQAFVLGSFLSDVGATHALIGFKLLKPVTQAWVIMTDMKTPTVKVNGTKIVAVAATSWTIRVGPSAADPCLELFSFGTFLSKRHIACTG
jgi:hypothetical protein